MMQHQTKPVVYSSRFGRDIAARVRAKAHYYPTSSPDTMFSPALRVSFEEVTMPASRRCIAELATGLGVSGTAS